MCMYREVHGRINMPHHAKWMLVVFFGLIAFVTLVPIVQGQPTAQIFVTGYTIRCDNFRILYTVNDTANGYYEAQVTVYTSNGTEVGSTNGPGQAGFNYAVDVSISPAQPEQTSLYVVIELYNGGTFISSEQTRAEPCYGGGAAGGGGSGRSSSKTSSQGGSSSQPQSTWVWEGLSDGRLNPDMAEYYTIYCEHSSIKVYGRSNDPNNTNPALIERIPLELAEALSPQGGQMIWNTGFLVPYHVTRGNDTITINGNFGYLMPQPGSKSFSLSQCQERSANTARDPGFVVKPEITFCIDYEGDGYTDPDCIRASQRPAGSAPFP